MARKLVLSCALAVLALSAAGSAAASDVATNTSAQRFVPGEALVRFEPGVAASERRDAREDARVSFGESLRLPRTQVVGFDGSVRAAIRRLEAQPGVAYAQPNYRYHALADTHFGQLWGLGSTPGVGAQPAWARNRGAGQVIAILDTGVDLTHPDLAGNLWTRPGGSHGFDFVDRDSDPDDHQFHGTHVAGTAAAIEGNGIGVAGVAPDAEIMAVRVLDGNGSGSTADIADGILFASSQGAGVINLSLGSPSGAGDTVMSNAATTAEQRGTVIVAAAGNEDSDNDQLPTSPCNLPNANILCVAALDDQSELASYSNFGDQSVDVGAPGGDFQLGEAEILSTKPSWGAPLFSEDFENVSDWNAFLVSPAGELWGQSANAAAGSVSAADSPAGDYENDTDSLFETDNPVSLVGRRGCRIHFLADLDIELPGAEGFFDLLAVGATSSTDGAGLAFADMTGGFVELDASISDLDGQFVWPFLEFISDAEVVHDGAFVDNLRLLCRASDYDDETVDSGDFELPAASGGSYMAISGTSMASPHAAGVAALVRAHDPGAPPSQIVQAIKDGAVPVASLNGFTVTGGAVDAIGAMDAALALPNPGTQPPPPPPPPPPPGASAPGKAAFGGRATVDGRGRFSIRVSGEAGARAAITVTANLPRGSAAAVRTVARRSFRIGASGRATVRLRLCRPARRVLRRAKLLRTRARVVLTDADGLKSSRTKTVRMALRARR